MSSEQIDIGIVTIIGPELEAILNAFHIDNQHDRLRQTGDLYWTRSIESRMTDAKLRLIVHSQGDAGNIKAGVAATKVIERFNPACMILFGIAAGRRSKCKIGDVVIPRAIVDTTMTVVEDGHSYGRPSIPSLPHVMTQMLRGFRFDQRDWHELFRALCPNIPAVPEGMIAEYENFVARLPRLHESAIFTSDVLLRDHEVLEAAARDLHQLIRIGEMESSGFISACSGRNPSIPWFVVRGVADFGDSFKDDSFHSWASCAAASYLKYFLQSGFDPDLLRTETPRERRLGDTIADNIAKPPTVFISYSRDNEEHQQWVRGLAERIGSRGVAVTIDIWETVSQPHHLEALVSAVSHHDYVLVVCTGRYRNSSESSTLTGEADDIISSMVFDILEARSGKGLRKKFVVVLRQGDYLTAIPDWLDGKPYFDLRGDSEREYEGLLREILARSYIAIPGTSGEEYVTNQELDADAGTHFLEQELPRLIHSLPPEEYYTRAALFVDIDGLTDINREKGKSVGDEVLIIIASLIRNQERVMYSGRCGDDTFYLILGPGDEQTASRVAKSLIRETASYEWSIVVQNLYVTCSVGYAAPRELEHPYSWLSRAIEGMLSAKAKGGNRATLGPKFAGKRRNVRDSLTGQDSESLNLRDYFS